jgi:bacterioferritin (cytochrome b1)
LEEVVAKVMKVGKAIKLFQTMEIVSLNTGNLTLEGNTLKNRLAIGEKEKAMFQEQLDKERDFLKGYKHNVDIWKKNKEKVE